MEAFASGDYSGAFEHWSPLAEGGNPDAQFSLGMLYLRGLGVAVNPVVAARWIRRAAERGRAQAQFTLGMMLSQGLGVAVDVAEAARWYRAAAQEGEVDAQLALGLLLVRGAEGEANYPEAAHWFKTAAARGNAAAFASLGLLFETGRGVPQNAVCAYAWFNLAAAGGNDAARSKRDSLQSKMTLEQLSRGQDLSSSASRAAYCEEDESPEVLSEIRKHLQALGLLAEGPDRTAVTRAVQSFQVQIGVRPTGRISGELLLLLRQRVE